MHWAYEDVVTEQVYSRLSLEVKTLQLIDVIFFLFSGLRLAPIARIAKRL